MSKLLQTCQNQFQLVKISFNLTNLDHTCQNWFKLVKIVQNLSKLVQTCQNLLILVKISHNLSKLLQSSPILVKLSEVLQTCLNLSKYQSYFLTIQIIVKNCHFVRSHGDWKAFQYCFFLFLIMLFNGHNN